MPKRSVFILDQASGPWADFLKEFFEDTSSLVQPFSDVKEASRAFVKAAPDIAFVQESLLSLALAQKIRVWLETLPGFRVFRIGTAAAPPSPLHYKAAWERPESLVSFQRELVQHLPFGDKIRVLVVDDEEEIGTMVRDYLEGRKAPVFEVDYAENGEAALGRLEKSRYDVAVLDIKMPVMKGDEFYREVHRKGISLPVIVFFDALSGDELDGIRRTGRVSVVEKGGRESAMPEMAALIKKRVYFG